MKEIDERILRYYDDELNPEEKDLFLRDLELDAELKAEWEFHGRLIEGIRSEGAMELKEYIKEHVGQSELASQSNLWMYAAASVAFLLLSYFAIYSYLETGSIKEATEIITLKDEKSDKFKFWKKKGSVAANSNSKSLGSDNAYIDSLNLLESARSADSGLIGNNPIVAAVEAENMPAFEEYEATTKDVESIRDNNSLADIATPNNLLSQLKIVPIKLGGTNEEKGLESVAAAAPIPTKKTYSSRLKDVSKIPASEEKKTKPADTSQLAKTGKTIKTKFYNTVQLNYFENPSSERTIEVFVSKGNLKLDLINIWGENPLIYEIGGVYYLDIGSFKGPKGKTFSGIWRIPESAGLFKDIEWVNDKTIIEKIRN